MNRVVLDTNIVISGTYWKGDSFKIIQLLEEGKITGIASIEILKEYKKGIEHPDIVEKIDELQIAQRAGVLKLFQKMTIVEPEKKIKASKDPDDNKFIEAAIEGNAQYIVSNDRDLLDIGKYEKIAILTPKEFLAKIRPKK